VTPVNQLVRQLFMLEIAVHTSDANRWPHIYDAVQGFYQAYSMQDTELVEMTEGITLY